MTVPTRDDRLSSPLRRRLGAAALAGGAAAGLGWSAIAFAGPSATGGNASELPVEGQMPELSGATGWLNSSPLTTGDLRGKVVLVDFWTYGCSNCRNALPYVRGWYETYKDQGFVVLGVHSPEFAYERRTGSIERAADELGLRFPIAIDNDFVIWRAFSNRYWPAHYFVDAKGRIRFHHFGEGAYAQSEQVIRRLLDEARTG